MDIRTTKSLSLSSLAALTLVLIGEGKSAPYLVAEEVRRHMKEPPGKVALLFRVRRVFAALEADGIIRRVDHRAYVINTQK